MSSALCFGLFEIQALSERRRHRCVLQMLFLCICLSLHLFPAQTPVKSRVRTGSHLINPNWKKKNGRCFFTRIFYYFLIFFPQLLWVQGLNCYFLGFFFSTILRSHPTPSPVAAVEGQWLEWGPWSACSVTCNTGSQQRQRRCSSSVHGWAECKGPHQESRECSNPSCNGECRHRSTV